MAGWRKWLIGLLLVAGIATGTYAWYRHRSPALSSIVPPEIPAIVIDSEVRNALSKARDRVLAEPRSGEAWGELGVLFRCHKILPQANACFAEACKLEPKNPRWPYLLGTDNLLLFTGDAIPYFRASYSIATQADEQSVVRLQLAEVLLDRNDVEEAEQLFKEELALYPDNPRARYGLGAIALARNDYDSAITHLTFSVKSPYYRHKAASLLVSCHSRLGNTSEAERYVLESRLPPNDLPWPDPFDSSLSSQQYGQSVRQLKVSEVGSQGRIEDVLKLLEEIGRTYPNDPTQVPRAVHLLKLGDYTGAEKACREALAINPDHASGRCFLGISMFFQAAAQWEKGNRDAARPLLEAALRELKKSIELKPDFGYAHLHSGFTLKYLGKQTEAAESFRMAIQVCPQDPNAHLALGELLIEMGKPIEAVPHLKDAARLLSPNDKRAKEILEKIDNKKG